MVNEVKDSFKKYVDLKPDFIIHCAALVNADLCEKDKNKGKSNILNGTKNVINFAKINNSKIFYPQSFLIYNDTNNVVDENTNPKPLCEYGRVPAQLECEKFSYKSILDDPTLRPSRME